jgi:heme-degrading monooxygenase HmoA
MPILEITQLRLKGLTADDPALLKTLSTVRDKLRTGSQFYNCIEDPTLIYILGAWPSLDAHLEFLASPARHEVLSPQEDMLQFCWTIHTVLGGIDLLPLDAPILAVERMRVGADHVEAFYQAMTRHTDGLRGSHPFKMAWGWRDDAAPESREAVLFTGWETARAHVTFPTKKNCIDCDNEVAAIDEPWETMYVTHIGNLERKET